MSQEFDLGPDGSTAQRSNKSRSRLYTDAITE